MYTGNWTRGLRRAEVLSAALLLAWAAGGSIGCKSGGGRGQQGTSDFTPSSLAGRYIVASCDVDMTADSFVTRDLGARDPRDRDLLTIVPLPIQEPVTPFAQVPVSSSALGPPRCMDVSLDGGTLYVVESRGEGYDGARTLDDLPPGQNLAVVDVSNPLAPQVVQNVYVGTNPSSVSVQPQGRYVAITTHTPGQQLVIAPLRDRRVEIGPDNEARVLGWPLIGVDDADELYPSCVSWHPDGSTLAVCLPGRDQVVFYRLSTDAQGEVTVAPWYKAVNVGKYPYLGSFTPDGRHYVVACVGWGQDVEGFSVGASPGQVDVIALGTVENQTANVLEAGTPHTRVSSATVGVSPKGLAVSPDGRLIATANLQASPNAQLPKSGAASPGGAGGSVSLLLFNPNAGQVSTIGEWILNAIPAGVSFDPSGGAVGVTQFRSFDPGAIDGEISFWRVVGNPRSGQSLGLESMDYYVGLGKGPHAVLIVP